MRWLPLFYVQGVCLSSAATEFQGNSAKKEKLLSDVSRLIKSVCRSTPQFKNTACAGAIPVFYIARYCTA